MVHRPPVLVIGGTGMLRPAVHTLLERGEDVAVLARRPDRTAPAHRAPGRFFPVVGNWQDPSSLAADVLAATGGRRPGTVIVWVHTPYRAGVLHQVRRVITTDATIIHLWGSATQDPRQFAEDTDEVARSRHVFLGYHRDDAGSRWLTDTEISRAVLRAMDGTVDHVTAGRIDPWDQRP